MTSIIRRQSTNLCRAFLMLCHLSCGSADAVFCLRLFPMDVYSGSPYIHPRLHHAGLRIKHRHLPDGHVFVGDAEDSHAAGAIAVRYVAEVGARKAVC
jgi:hypothetical protein